MMHLFHRDRRGMWSLRERRVIGLEFSHEPLNHTESRQVEDIVKLLDRFDPSAHKELLAKFQREAKEHRFALEEDVRHHLDLVRDHLQSLGVTIPTEFDYPHLMQIAFRRGWLRNEHLRVNQTDSQRVEDIVYALNRVDPQREDDLRVQFQQEQAQHKFLDDVHAKAFLKILRQNLREVPKDPRQDIPVENQPTSVDVPDTFSYPQLMQIAFRRGWLDKLPPVRPTNDPVADGWRVNIMTRREEPRYIPLARKIPGVPSYSYDVNGVTIPVEMSLPGNGGNVVIDVLIQGGSQYMWGQIAPDGRSVRVMAHGNRLLDLPMDVLNRGAARKGATPNRRIDNALLMVRPLTSRSGGRTISAGGYRYNSADRPGDMLNASPFNTKNMRQIAPGHFERADGTYFQVPGAPPLAQSIDAEKILSESASRAESVVHPSLGQAAMTAPPQFTEQSYQRARDSFTSNPYGNPTQFYVELQARSMRRKAEVEQGVRNDRLALANERFAPLVQRLMAIKDYPYASFGQYPRMFDPLDPAMRTAVTSVRSVHNAVAQQVEGNMQLGDDAVVPRLDQQVRDVEYALKGLDALRDQQNYSAYSPDIVRIIKQGRNPFSFIVKIGADAARGVLRIPKEWHKLELVRKIGDDTWIKDLPGGLPGWQYRFHTKNEKLYAYEEAGKRLQVLDPRDSIWRPVPLPAARVAASVVETPAPTTAPRRTPAEEMQDVMALAKADPNVWKGYPDMANGPQYFKYEPDTLRFVARKAGFPDRVYNEVTRKWENMESGVSAAPSAALTAASAAPASAPATASAGLEEYNQLLAENQRLEQEDQILSQEEANIQNMEEMMRLGRTSATDIANLPRIKAALQARRQQWREASVELHRRMNASRS